MGIQYQPSVKNAHSLNFGRCLPKLVIYLAILYAQLCTPVWYIRHCQCNRVWKDPESKL